MMDLYTSKLGKLSISERLFLTSLFLSLGTGKWGAYIGVPRLNIYLIDMLFFASLVLSPRLFRIKRHKFLILFSTLYILFEVVLARTRGFSISLYIRDLAPFIYLLTIPFISASTSKITERSILKCIKWACLLHATWISLVFFNLITTVNCSPICGVPLFIQRTDQTGFVCAIGFLAWYLSKESKLVLRSSVQGLFLITAFLAHSRAGLLALLFSVFITIAYDFNSKHDTTRFYQRLKPIPVTASVILVFLILFSSFSSIFPQDSSISRLLNTNFLSELSSFESGTLNARAQSQRLLLNWTLENGNIVFGNGAGSEMLLNSGAVRYLSGALDVRAPHSWWVSALCRFGILGLALWSFSIILYLRSPSLRTKKFRAFLFSCVIFILITATFGVIIESPFGSLPLVMLLGLATRGHPDD